jgi:hypothetical protein
MTDCRCDSRQELRLPECSNLGVLSVMAWFRQQPALAAAFWNLESEKSALRLLILVAVLSPRKLNSNLAGLS